MFVKENPDKKKKKIHVASSSANFLKLLNEGKQFLVVTVYYFYESHFSDACVLSMFISYT